MRVRGESRVQLRAIGVIPSRDWFGFAVKESTGLTSVGDIARKRFPLRLSLREQRDHSVHLVLDQVLQAHGFSLSDITQLVVSVPPPYLRMIDHGVFAGDRSSHLTSVSYQMALAAFAPDALFDVKQAPERVSGEIGAFCAAA